MDTHFDPRMQFDTATAVGALHLLGVSEGHALALGVNTVAGHVVETQDHILRGHDDRVTRCRRQNVIGRHHERTGFELCFQRQRHVHRHLVAIKVRVVRRTHQRVQLNRFTFNQHGLEGLNTQTVECRRPVQKNGVLADDLSEDIPHFWGLTLNHFLGGLDRARQTTELELAKDERLEELQCHLLGQTALVKFERRTGHDHRTTGVIHALAQQVLTEATLLTLDHVSQRLERTLIGAGNRPATSAVIQQRVD